jgi:hypothetical protein
MYFYEDNNKFFNFGNVSNSALPKMKNIEIGWVASVNDPNSIGRIKVRIKGSSSQGGDDSISDDNDLPWSFPMLPKFFSVTPKVGEAVYVFVFGKDKEHTDRLYFGPIISQPQNFLLDKFPNSLAGFEFGLNKPDISYQQLKDVVGVFPDKEDVSIQGRYNTDITQKPNEIILRAGKFIEIPKTENNIGFKFNNKNQAYIQIKNNVNLTTKSVTDNNNNSNNITSIVSDKINFLTHNGLNNYELNNPDGLLTDVELSKIIGTTEEGGAQRMVYGDLLLEYLILLREAFSSHVHNNQGTSSPTDNTLIGNSVDTFNKKAVELEKRLLSKNIRIN